MASLAELLDYQARKKQVLDALNNASTGIENVSYGLGEGFADQVRGMGQLVQHPIQSVQDVYQAVKQAVQNPRQALEGVKQYAQEAVSSPTAFAKAVGQNVNPMELANALKKAGAMRELTVYHGTPHRLPPTEANPLGEFDASKIGTGEGAQAYGHGIYVAESPDVAKTYTNVGRYNPNAKELPEHAYEELSPIMIKYKIPGDTMPGINEADSLRRNVSVAYDKMTKKEQAIIDKWAAPKGTFYTVDLPDEMIDKMLSWDKPFSAQSANVKQALKDSGLYKEYKDNLSNFASPMDSRGKEMRGSNLHSFLEWKFGGDSAKAADYLRQQGIPGIRYLDATSRDAKKGTRNFVVFPGEEKKAKIIKRE